MKLFAIFLLMTMSAFVVQAQDAAVEEESTGIALVEEATQDGKAEIKTEELPQPVIDPFKASEYANWAIEKVYQIDSEGNDSTYEIVVHNGDEFTTIAADGEGNMVKKEE